MKSLVVCGSFGFGNIGDEAVPFAIEDLADSIGINVKTFPVGRYNSTPLKEVIDLGPQDIDKIENLRGLPVLVVGGGIIEEKESGTFYRCRKLFDKKFSSISRVFACSVEPGVSYSFLMKVKLMWLLRHQPIVYVRDEISASVFRSEFPRKTVEVIGDSVLALKSDESLLPSELCLPPKFVAISLAPRWNDDSWFNWVANELSNLAEERNVSLVFTPMAIDGDNDVEQHAHVIKRIKALNENLSIVEIEQLVHPRALSAIFAKAECVVSMRLHGCVMAYAQKTPFVGIAYHHKLKGFARTVDCEENVIPHEIPKLQSNGAYGFSFTDINLDKCSLDSSVEYAVKNTCFGKLDFYKQKLGITLKNILDEDDKFKQS